MEDYSTPSQRSKVTLSNWVRLNNAPLLLPRASAVQWNDYVFVLASDDTALLYHNKHNMWSMLPNSPYTSTNFAPALTLHNGRILTMSSNGLAATFDPQLCRWTVLDDMRMDEGNRPRLLVSSNNNLYSVVDFKTQVKQETYLSLARLQQQPLHTDCTVFSYNPNSKWEKICEIGSSPLKSAAVVGGTLFVHAGEEMFKLTLPVKPTVVANLRNTKLPPTTTNMLAFLDPVLAVSHTGINTTPSKKTPRNRPAPLPVLQSATACASPTYAGSTLHAIKDTLFSFGGRDKDNQPTSDVLRYNPDTDTWESAGYMRSCRYNVAVATVQDTTLVLGGSLGSSEYTMTQQPNYPSEPVGKRMFGSGGLKLGSGGLKLGSGGLQLGSGGLKLEGSPSPPAWDNKTSIIEKCTVN